MDLPQNAKRILGCRATGKLSQAGGFHRRIRQHSRSDRQAATAHQSHEEKRGMKKCWKHGRTGWHGSLSPSSRTYGADAIPPRFLRISYLRQVAGRQRASCALRGPSSDEGTWEIVRNPARPSGDRRPGKPERAESMNLRVQVSAGPCSVPQCRQEAARILARTAISPSLSSEYLPPSATATTEAYWEACSGTPGLLTRPTISTTR